MVEGNAHIIDMQHEIGTQRGKLRKPRMGLKAAAEVIADVARNAPLEWRQARQLRQAVAGENPVQHNQRRIFLHNSIKQGPAIGDLQGGRRIAGQERIAPQLFLPHGAFKQGEKGLPAQALGQLDGFPIDDLAGMNLRGLDGRMLHGTRDIRLAGPPVQDYSRAMNSDSTPIADVLLPLALEGPYSYRIPAGLDPGGRLLCGRAAGPPQP